MNLNIWKNLNIKLILVGLVIASMPFPVLAQRNNTIQSLPDGVHRVCERTPPDRNVQDFVVCASFKKRGNRVIGHFYITDVSDGSICIDGVVNNNTISGQGVYSIHSYIPLDTERNSSSTFEEFLVPRLRVRNHRVIINPNIQQDSGRNYIHYRSLLLDLSNMNYQERLSINNDRANLYWNNLSSCLP